MQKFIDWFKSSAGAFFSLLFITQLIAAIYASYATEPPSAFVFLVNVVLLLTLLYWFRTDSKKTSFGMVSDIGFFLIIAWPILLPYYLFKTRGAKALAIILAAIVVYFVPLLFVFFIFSSHAS